MDNVTFWSEHSNQVGDVTQDTATYNLSPTNLNCNMIWVISNEVLWVCSLWGWTQEVQVWFQFIKWGIIPCEFLSDNEQMNEALLDDEITKERSILGNVIWTGMLLVKKFVKNRPLLPFLENSISQKLKVDKFHCKSQNVFFDKSKWESPMSSCLAAKLLIFNTFFVNRNAAWMHSTFKLSDQIDFWPQHFQNLSKAS